MVERTLRTYERMAQAHHWCDRCCTYIKPGDFYEGRVTVDNDRHHNKLKVWKTHIFPSCEFPEEPEDEVLEDEEFENLESRIEKSASEQRGAA